MLLWDADAISRGLRDVNLKWKVSQAIAHGNVRISAHTIVELSVGMPSEEAAKVLAEFFRQDAQLEVPEAADFREAGRRLARQPRPKGTKGQRADARLRLTMDAILAAVAWRRGWRVVTYNTKDFLRLRETKAESIVTPDAILE